jgi:protein-tyrosine phosphatase
MLGARQSIDSLQVSATGGRIGLCACPGLERSLATDLERLRDWGAHGLVSLIEDHEFAMLGVHSLPGHVEALGMHWWHLPIRDMGTPDQRFEARWRQAGGELRGLLGEGVSIAVHCRGGLGRTGMIAARLLVELGSEPGVAVARVREVRPGSIETREQEEFVYGCTTV